MNQAIKHRETGAALFSGDYDTWQACLEAAVAARANLSGADLKTA